MSCGVGCRISWDLALLWLWCKPAATALIHSLAWEPLYASGTALNRQKKKKKNLANFNEEFPHSYFSGLMVDSFCVCAAIHLHLY